MSRDLRFFYRLYCFRGSIKPTGIIWCLRDHRGDCVEHGLEFGTLAKVLKQESIPKEAVTFAPRPIKAFGTCKAVRRQFLWQRIIRGKS